MLVIDRRAEQAGSQVPPPPGPRRRGPVVAMAVGLALAMGAVAAARLAGTTTTPPVATVTDPLAITLSARDVAVVTQVYEPGQASGWHVHPGIHAVAVISGVLTVYDAGCQPRTVEAGRPYVGGQQPHLVRNETDAPVVMAVTYLNPSAPRNSTEHVPAPAGCAVG